MSLVGNLEDLGLGEILQIVSLSRRSGVLSLESRGREARIIFQSGQVTRASSTTFQQNLGEVLIQKGVIDLTTLKRALSIQADEGYRQLLGGIMIERFGISADAIEAVVREQIENVVYSLFAWAEGTFEFELQEIAEGDAARLDPVQFMLKQGLNPQYLAMEGSRIIDEKRHRGETDDEGEEPAGPEPSLDLAFDLLQHAPLPAAEQKHAPREAASAEPAPLSAAPLTAAPFTAAPLTAVPEARHGRPLVLVDDDPGTLEALAFLLEQQGYRVDAIDRGEDALIRVDCLYRDGVRPTVVVDLIMPRMDGTGILGGLELMELVRGNFPELPLLALSDFHNEDAQRKARGMGIAILMKPLKGELSEGIPAFAPKLLAGVAKAEAAGLGLTLSRVNIGDELRLEMGEEPALAAPFIGQSIGLSHLRGMLEELNNPSLGGEIILLVLRFAAEFMNRAVVLLVKKDSIQGLGQFGMDDRDGSADARVRSLRIPRGEPSLFAPVLETRFPMKGKVDDSRWSNFFLGQLGDARPSEVFVGPIVSEGKVVAVLYGDNLPEDKPIGDTDSLEIFLSQAGIAMEKALLQRRLQDQVQEGR
ncbi:MAG TPA: response regulator [Geomonas sp.]